MFDGFYFNSKKEKNINFASFDKLNNNKSTADLSKLLNIFDKDENKTIDVSEMRSLFDELKQHAGTDNILSNDEFEAWCRMKPELDNVDTKKLYSDLNNVLTQEIFKYTNSEGNLVEDIVSYSEGRPSQVIRKINGKESEELYYTYNEEATSDSKVIVTIKSVHDSDNVKIVTVPEVDNKGRYDSSQISTQCMVDLRNETFLQLIKVDGKIYSETDCVLDGKKFVLYNEYDISSFDELKEGETEASLQLMIDESGEQYFVSYENGYTIFHAKLNETVDSLCRTFNISEAELLELNPELKKGVLVGQEIKINGIYPVFAPEMKGRNNPVKEEKKYLDHLQKQYEKELVENVSTHNKEYVVADKSYTHFADLLKELWEKQGHSINEEEFGLFVVSMLALNPQYAEGEIEKGVTIISLKQDSLINEKCLTNLKKAGYPMTLDNMEFYGRVGLLNEDLQLYLADLAADGDISEADKDAFNNKVEAEIRRYEDESGYTSAYKDAAKKFSEAFAKDKSTNNINWPDRSKYNIPEFPRNIFDSGIILNISPYRLSYSGYNSNISANWAAHANIYANVQPNNNQEISVPNRIETILLSYNIDPNSVAGKEIISRLKSFDTDSNGLIASFGKYILDKNTDEYWQAYFNSQMHILSSSENVSISDFDRFANYLLTCGINIRTEAELKAWENSAVGEKIINEAAKITQKEYNNTIGADLQFKGVKEQAITAVSVYYDYMINLFQSYQDSNGILNVGTWREAAGQVLSFGRDIEVAAVEGAWDMIPDGVKDYVPDWIKDAGRKALDKAEDIDFSIKDEVRKLENEKNEKIAELEKSFDPSNLSYVWKRSMGTEYNPELITNACLLSAYLFGGSEGKQSLKINYPEAYSKFNKGSQEDNMALFENYLRQLTPNDSYSYLGADFKWHNTNQYDAVKIRFNDIASIDQAGDVAVIIATLSGTSWAKKLGANVIKALELKSKPILGFILGSASSAGIMAFYYNGVTRPINLLTNEQKNTWEDYNNVAKSCFIDAGFGALGGMANALGYFTKYSILGNSAKNLASKYYTPPQNLKVRAQRIATCVGLGVEFATDIGTTYALQRGVLGKEVEAGQYVQSLVMTFAGGGAAYNVRSKFVDAETDFVFSRASYNHIKNMDYAGRLNFFKNDFKQKGLPDGIADVYAAVMVEKYSAHFRKVEASNTSVSLGTEVTIKHTEVELQKSQNPEPEIPRKARERAVRAYKNIETIESDLVGVKEVKVYSEAEIKEFINNGGDLEFFSQCSKITIKDALGHKKPLFSVADILKMQKTGVLPSKQVCIELANLKNADQTSLFTSSDIADFVVSHGSKLEVLLPYMKEISSYLQSGYTVKGLDDLKFLFDNCNDLVSLYRLKSLINIGDAEFQVKKFEIEEDLLEKCYTLEAIKIKQEELALHDIELTQEMVKARNSVIIYDHLFFTNSVPEFLSMLKKYDAEGIKYDKYYVTEAIEPLISKDLLNLKKVEEIDAYFKDLATKEGLDESAMSAIRANALAKFHDENLKQADNLDQLYSIMKSYEGTDFAVPQYLYMSYAERFVRRQIRECYTIDDVLKCKAEIDAKVKGINFDAEITTRIKELMVSDFDNCTSIADVIKIKSELDKMGIHDDSLYVEAFSRVLTDELQQCKTISEVNKLQESYKAKDYGIPEEVFNSQKMNLLLAELKACKSNGALEAVRTKANSEGIKITDEIFDYYSKKIMNPELSEIEVRIRSGNQTSKGRFQQKRFDPNDPKYVDDIPGVCRELQARFEREMGVLKDEDISYIAQTVSKRLQIPEAEVLEIMSRLTQFGNVNSLKGLAAELDKYGVSDFYKEGGISTNSALNYLRAREQILLSIQPESGKKAFILDDASLKYLEGLDDSAKRAFYNDVINGKIVIIEMDGTALKIGDRYYSYIMLDGGQSLEAMTEAVALQVKSGKTHDEVFQSDMRQRLAKVFNDPNIASQIKTVSLDRTATAQNVTAQIKPNLPDADYIQEVITRIVDENPNLSPEERALAPSVIAKYYDYMAKVYSSDSFAEILKLKHDVIEQQVLQLGKTMDDVVYIYPKKEKSFDLVCLQYAKINGIDPSKIVFYKGDDVRPELNGKVLVLLDDVVGSGRTMVTQEFKYESHLKNQASNIFFAPITCAEQGKISITNHIKANSRVGQDFLLYDSAQSSSTYESFVAKLSPEEHKLFSKVVGGLGFLDGGLSTGFQHMTPDNNTTLSGYLLLPNLNNPRGEANKPLSNMNKFITDKLLDYLQNRRL